MRKHSKPVVTTSVPACSNSPLSNLVVRGPCSGVLACHLSLRRHVVSDRGP